MPCDKIKKKPLEVEYIIMPRLGIDNNLNFDFPTPPTHAPICETLLESHVTMEVLLFLLGVQPLSMRQAKFYLQVTYPSLAWMMPEFVYVPGWLLAAVTHKF